MIRAIIVDDEAPARSELRFVLDEIGGVDVVAEAANVRSALEQLKETGADLMFLDINMPGADGLALAEGLGRLRYPPLVIFVTAYNQHAVKAFEVNAIDYLVKPVEVDRLRQAVERAASIVESNSHHAERVLVEKAGRKLLIPAASIFFIMAKDDYSYIFAGNERYLSTVSLAKLEERLAPHGFYRAHRRYLVNLSKVTEVNPVSGGTLTLTIAGYDEPIPVSRRRVSALKSELSL